MTQLRSRAAAIADWAERHVERSELRQAATNGAAPLAPPPAFYGLAGRFVEVVRPHTEADDWGLLLTFLTAFGAGVGRGPHARADGADHPARLFTVLVGSTSKGRKGTTWAQVRRVFAVADPHFIDSCVRNGFGSGEALVDALAEGEDRRAFVVEPEWGRILAVGRRDGSTLSPLLRQAWDGERLAVLSRAGKAIADGAHVAVVGHITSEELRAKLTDVEVANGYANRHLFVPVKRSKLLPSGGNLDDADVAALGSQVRAALEVARKVGLVVRTRDAEDRWAELYGEMAGDEPPGLLGAIIARDQAQVLRLSVAYALTDGTGKIDIPHLEAAWSAWSYCRRAAVRIFGELTGDPVADRLLAAIRAAGPDGLAREGQHAAMGGHTAAKELDRVATMLAGLGLVDRVRRTTGGRPADVLVARGERSEVSEGTTGAHTLSSHTSLASHDDVPPEVRDGWADTDLEGAEDPW